MVAFSVQFVTQRVTNRGCIEDSLEETPSNFQQCGLVGDFVVFVEARNVIDTASLKVYAPMQPCMNVAAEYRARPLFD